MFSRWEKGFIHLGIIGIIVLAGGLFAVTKLASNPDFTFFNIAEDAAGVEESSCKGCDGRHELRWDRKRKVCIRRVSIKCSGIIPAPKPVPASPKPSPTNGVPKTFETPYVSLKASDFSIFANGKSFGKKMENLVVNSDPNDSGDPNYTTLEAQWKENGVEMRLFMYFYKNNEKWWMSEMRIYNGKNPGDWLEVDPFPNGTNPDMPSFKEIQPNYSAKLGQPYKGLAGYLFTSGGDAVVGSVDFGNLELLPFRKKIIIEPPKPTPTPVSKACGCRGNYLICDITKDQIVDKIEFCSGGCEALATVQGGPDGFLPGPAAVCRSGSKKENGQMCQANSECKSNSCVIPNNPSGLSLGTLDLGKVCQ